MTDWRKVPRSERPYNAYERARYVEAECEHNGPHCKCDPPMWLREPTPAELSHWPVARRVERIAEAGG
jgi:hypothetical protein